MAETLITTLRDGLALRAPAMIVTIYGDVVVPRGGVLWMGTLIEIGAALGFSETLVRTAVSRLVAAGQLAGEREGRRSFYRLAENARQEFSAAARLLYGKPARATGWQIHHAPGLTEEAARRGALARMAGDLWLRPDHPGFAAPGLCFRSEPLTGIALLPEYVAGLWPLDRHAAAYRAMIAQFSPLGDRLASGLPVSAETALVARLLLVHAYRGALLRDPRLPEAALPGDWPGEAARTLFAQLYRTLSPAADSYIGTRFEGGAGLLPARTAETQARLLALSED